MTDIYATATKHYTQTEVTDALRVIHSQKDIEKKTRGDDVIYCIKRPRTKTAIGWRLPDELYPVMDSTNDASHPIFKDMDFSVLFMSVEERQQHEFNARNEAIT